MSAATVGYTYREGEPGRKRVEPEGAPVAGWLLLAAALALTVSALAIWRATRASAPDVLRGDESAVRLIEPLPGADIEAGEVFVWHPIANATDDQLEVIDHEGNSLVAAATIDTTYMMPADLIPGAGVR